MTSSTSFSPAKRLTVSVVLLFLSVASGPMSGQSAPPVHVGGVDITGVPEDWSHHHVVFANPGTEQEAIQGDHFQQWTKIVNNPFYVLQQLKRNAPVAGPAATDSIYRTRWILETAVGGGTQDVEPTGGFGGRTIRPVTGFRKPIRPRTDFAKDWSVPLGGPGLSAGQYPAKYSAYWANGIASCSDFVVFPTGAAGSTSQATIVAFNNLYDSATPGAGCNGTLTTPTTFWAYNTGGTSKLSPVMSWDGTQLAFVQVVSNVASLVILKTAASGGAYNSPASISFVTPADYKSCNTGRNACYTTITLSGNHSDTRSAPFYDYTNDTIYVGDDSGVLHQITNVFGASGTPAETFGNGWPVTVHTGDILTSPVLEPVSGNIFMGDSAGYLSYVNTVGTATATLSAQLSNAASTLGIMDAPLIDEVPATPLVYAFVGDSAASTSLVEQFTTNFVAGASALLTANVGVGGAANETGLYSGTFDNLHYTIGGTGGFLYVCGWSNVGTRPELFRITMSGTFGATSTAENSIVSATATCSPVTEYLGSKANTTLGANVTTTINNATTLAGAINHATAPASTTLATAMNHSSQPANTTLAAVINHNTQPATTSLSAAVNHTTQPAGTTLADVINHASQPGATSLSAAINHTTQPTGTTLASAINHATQPTGTTLASAINHATQPATTTLSSAINHTTAPTGVTTTSAMTASSTTFTVSAANIGSFLAGDYISIANTTAETMQVTAVSTVTNTVTVTRALNGTTAQTHTIGASVTFLINLVHVASVTNIAAGDYIQIDSEIMSVTSVFVAGAVVTVTRAVDGTTAATHTSGKTVTTLATLVHLTSAASTVVGDYIQVGTEDMQVTAISGTILTVTRAVNGTTAATHTNGTAVAYLITLVNIASATNIAVGDFVQVDSEDMLVTALNGTMLTVTRARNGTTGATHSSGAALTNLINLVAVGTAANITVGDYIRTGTEDMQVSAINSSTLTVTRGAAGTSAATHATASSVTILTNLVHVTSATNILVGDFIQVNSEDMLVTAIAGSTYLTVTRATDGTTEATHTNSTAVANLINLLAVASTTNITAGDFISVGTEDFQVTAKNGTTLETARGIAGTTVATHTSGSTVSILTTLVDVTSAANIVIGDYIQVDTEVMQVSTIVSGSYLTVTRAAGGTTEAVHSNGATTTILTNLVNVSSATNVLAGDYIKIGSETMFVSSKSGTVLTVTRAANATTEANHASAAAVSIPVNLVTVQTGATVMTGDYILVGSEEMNITAENTTTGVGLTLTVTRATDGTTAGTDANGSAATVLNPISVASSTGIAKGDYVEIDTDIMQVGAVANGTTLHVVQGSQGTTGATHTSGSAVHDIQDWVYLSVSAGGGDTGCTGACLYNFSTTTTTSPTGSTDGIAETGGTSGIIIDNISTTQTGAQQIYFNTLTGNNAVQTSQAAP